MCCGWWFFAPHTLTFLSLSILRYKFLLEFFIFRWLCCEQKPTHSIRYDCGNVYNKDVWDCWRVECVQETAHQFLDRVCVSRTRFSVRKFNLHRSDNDENSFPVENMIFFRGLIMITKIDIVHLAVKFWSEIWYCAVYFECKALIS